MLHFKVEWAKDIAGQTTVRITLFFTYGASLKTWADAGLLKREVHLYHELMKKYNIEVQFLTYGNESDRQWEADIQGIKLLPVYERLTSYPLKSISLLQTILIPLYFRKEFRQSDVLKTNQIWGGWVAVLVKIIFKKPLLVRCGYEAYKNELSLGGGGLYSYILKYVSWLSYKNADHIMLTTDEIYKFVKSTFSVSSTRITVQPNWIDTGLFKPNNRVKKHKSRVLFVGRISEEKNIPLLLNALHSTNIGLDIVGDGNLKQEIAQLAAELNVDVNFLGKISNDIMPDIYNQYRIYILCSNYEGNPKSLLEAMSCGCAVIGTNVTGIREVIIHNKNGLLVDRSKDELRRSIIMLFADELLVNVLSNSAKQDIIKFNSISYALKREYEIYSVLKS